MTSRIQDFQTIRSEGGLLPAATGPEINGRTYAISRFFGPVPVHLRGSWHGSPAAPGGASRTRAATARTRHLEGRLLADPGWGGGRNTQRLKVQDLLNTILAKSNELIYI
jgi:hypothetical protein